MAIYDPKVDPDQIAQDLAAPSSASDGPLSGVGVWQSAPNPLAAATGADAVLVLTEWAEFRSLDWAQLAAVMRQPAWLFDARRIVDASAARDAGLNLWQVGNG